MSMNSDIDWSKSEENVGAGLIAGGKDTKEGRQTVLFTALEPMSNESDEEYQDVSGPRKVHHESMWQVTQDAVDGINLREAQDEG